LFDSIKGVFRGMVEELGLGFNVIEVLAEKVTMGAGEDVAYDAEEEKGARWRRCG
jgi:hypothetical protein